MDKTDVVVMIEGDSFSRAAESVQSLKHHLKTDIGGWFLFGTKSEKMDRLAYDLGCRLVIAMADKSSWGKILSETGSAPNLLLWTVTSALMSEWHPWNSQQAKIWKKLPAALVTRQELGGWKPECYEGTMSEVWQARRSLHAQTEWLPDNQLTELNTEDYEKHITGTFRMPFSPKVAVLKTK